MSKLIKSMTLLILSLCPLWVTAARVSPVTLSFQNGVTRITTLDTGRANYLVSMDASMPTGLSLSLSPSDYSWVTQVTRGRSACTSPAAPICATQFSLSPGSSCCLMLSLSGAGVAVGSYSLSPIVSTTPATYQYTVTSPTPVTVIVATEVLTSSVSSLGLNINGQSRQVTITNSSTTNTAFNVNFSYSALPAGTTITSNATPNTTCGDMAPLGTCILTISPGSTTSAVTYDLDSTPITLSIVGEHTNRLTLPVDILTLGSVYQSGFIYSIDDTTPTTGSIGGKVAALTDQKPTAPNGIFWSSNSSGYSVDSSSIYGISETSTTLSANPSSSQVTGQVACNGGTDGSCNSSNIITYYSPPNTNPAITYSFYAAGLCKATIGGYSDWYLPAICEMGPVNTNVNLSGCPSGTPNMLENLPELYSNPCTGTSCLVGPYWSSTEDSIRSNGFVWYQLFSSSSGNLQAIGDKIDLLGVRCSRALTP